MNDLVTVITPAYNSEDYIAGTIESVISQTYTRWEMIVVDDASTDSTAEIVNSYSRKDKRIRYIALKKNSGPGKARNVAIELAEGRYIAFLDSDDRWLENKLERQLTFMKNQGITFSFTKYSYHNQEGQMLKEYNAGPLSCGYYRLLLHCCIGCSTVIIDTTEPGKKYMADIRRRQDWTLWLMYTRKGSKAYGISESLTEYTVRPDSISSSKLKLIKYHWKVYKKVLKYNGVYSFILLSVSLIMNLFYFMVNRFQLKGELVR